MEYGDRDQEVIVKGMQRLTNETKVKKYIKEPLEGIVTPLLKGGKVPFLESTAVVEVLLFIHINLLGYLYSGSDSTVHAVKFLREYLGRVDSRYKEVGGLLYNLLRHGWVHRFTPKMLKLNNGTILDFHYSLDMNRGDHIKMVEIEGAKKLLISLSLLYSDLISAIDLFAEDVCHSQDVSDTFRRAFENRRKPEEESVLRKKNKGYLNQDLDYICDLLK